MDKLDLGPAENITADKPPKPGAADKKPPATKTAPKRKGPGRPPKPNLDAKLQEMIGMVAIGLTTAGMVRGNPKLGYDGQVLLANTERLSAALVKAARENPAIHRLLDLLVTTSTWGEVIGALATVAIPILANHGAIPAAMASLVGAEPPPDAPAKVVSIVPPHAERPTTDAPADDDLN